MTFSTLHLSDEDSARIDALAVERHVTPVETLAAIVRTGLAREAALLLGSRVVVNIEGGLCASERSVRFESPERLYALIVDVASVHAPESTMFVDALATRGDEVFVQCECVGGVTGMWLPRSMVRGMPAPPTFTSARSAPSILSRP